MLQLAHGVLPVDSLSRLKRLLASCARCYLTSVSEVVLLRTDVRTYTLALVSHCHCRKIIIATFFSLSSALFPTRLRPRIHVQCTPFAFFFRSCCLWLSQRRLHFLSTYEAHTHTHMHQARIKRSRSIFIHEKRERLFCCSFAQSGSHLCKQIVNSQDGSSWQNRSVCV